MSTPSLRRLCSLTVLALSACIPRTGSPVSGEGALELYFLDVEGGQSTLMVGPTGESLLVDTGWPGTRDAERILAATRAAGVDTIDYLVITHYHDDHVGGMEEVVRRIPIRNLISHGPGSSTDRMAMNMTASYQAAIQAAGLKELIVRPGATIPIEGLDIRILTADRQLIPEPLPGAGQPNPLCATATRRRADTSDNSASVGMLISFGAFRFLDIGDVTQDLEYELACPLNRIGEVDLYLTTHHGAGSSNAEVLVHALSPRVAIMNNGARKGGDPVVVDVVRRSPGLEDLWMLHFSEAGGAAGNVEAERIANLDETPTATGNDAGYGMRVTARRDGSFRVTNERNGYTKEY